MRIDARVNEAQLQFDIVKNAFEEVIPLRVFEILAAQDLELRCCGHADVNIDILKKHTRFSNSMSDTEKTEQLEKWFWQMLEEFTPT